MSVLPEFTDLTVHRPIIRLLQPRVMWALTGDMQAIIGSHGWL